VWDRKINVWIKTMIFFLELMSYIADLHTPSWNRTVSFTSCSQQKLQVPTCWLAHRLGWWTDKRLVSGFAVKASVSYWGVTALLRIGTLQLFSAPLWWMTQHSMSDTLQQYCLHYGCWLQDTTDILDMATGFWKVSLLCRCDFSTEWKDMHSKPMLG
jgi:hypothetical protein